MFCANCHSSPRAKQEVIHGNFSTNKSGHYIDTTTFSATLTASSSAFLTSFLASTFAAGFLDDFSSESELSDEELSAFFWKRNQTKIMRAVSIKCSGSGSKVPPVPDFVILKSSTSQTFGWVVEANAALLLETAAGFLVCFFSLPESESDDESELDFFLKNCANSVVKFLKNPMRVIFGIVQLTQFLIMYYRLWVATQHQFPLLFWKWRNLYKLKKLTLETSPKKLTLLATAAGGGLSFPANADAFLSLFCSNFCFFWFALFSASLESVDDELSF